MAGLLIYTAPVMHFGLSITKLNLYVWHYKYAILFLELHVTYLDQRACDVVRTYQSEVRRDQT